MGRALLGLAGAALLSLGLAWSAGSAAADPKVPSLSGLRCAEGEVPRYDEIAGQWLCSGALTQVIEDVANLATLPSGCGEGDVARFVGGNWVCSDALTEALAAIAAIQPLKAFDGNDVEIGPAVGANDVLLQHNGTNFYINLRHKRFAGARVYYANTGCAGQAYIQFAAGALGAMQLAGLGTDPGNGDALSAFLIDDPNSATVSPTTHSVYQPDGNGDLVCVDQDDTQDVRTASAVIDLSGYVPDFYFGY